MRSWVANPGPEPQAAAAAERPERSTTGTARMGTRTRAGPKRKASEAEVEICTAVFLSPSLSPLFLILYDAISFRGLLFPWMERNESNYDNASVLFIERRGKNPQHSIWATGILNDLKYVWGFLCGYSDAAELHDVLGMEGVQSAQKSFRIHRTYMVCSWWVGFDRVGYALHCTAINVITHIGEGARQHNVDGRIVAL